MDKRLVYEPNVDLSNYNTYQEPMSNYTPISNSQNMQNAAPLMQQQMQQPMQQPMQQQMHQMISPQYMNQSKYNIESMTTKKKSQKPSKFKEFCSTATLRKIFVITILYIVLSHNKTSLLLCNNIPYIYITNALSYNIVKGIIMSLIIILFWDLI